MQKKQLIFNLLIMSPENHEFVQVNPDNFWRKETLELVDNIEDIILNPDLINIIDKKFKNWIKK